MDERRAIEALLGGYVATLAVPAGALPGGPAEGAAPVTLAGAWLAVAAAVALAARAVPALPERAASLPVAAATTLPPLAYLPYLLARTEPGTPAGTLAAVGLLAVAPGMGVPVGGALLERRRARRAATAVATVTVGDADGRSGHVAAAVVLAGVVLVGAGAFALVGAADGVTPLVTAAGGIASAATLLARDDEREVTVTDGGVQVDGWFVPHDRLAGYRVTDDAVALVRTARYLPDRSFDRAAVDEEAALLDALGEFLPRLDEQGGVERVARR